MMWRINKGEQLCDPRTGATIAQSGDLIDENHQAVLACPDIGRIASRVVEEAASSAPATADKPLILDAQKLAAAFPTKRADDSDPGDEA